MVNAQLGSSNGVGLSYIVTSSEKGLEILGALSSQFRLISLRSILEVLEKSKDRIHRQRREMGLHDAESVKYRREVWEITAAKLYALNLVESEIAASSENLTVEKSTLFFLQSEAEEHARAESLLRSLNFLSDAGIAAAKKDAIKSVIEKLSGSAGTQPKNGEEVSAIGSKPVTPGPTLDAFFDSLSVADLHSVSELALEAMERRSGAEYEWNVADRFSEAVKSVR